MGMAKAKKKTLITGPYPTAEDMVRIFGVSMARIRRIEREAELIMAENDRKASEKAARKKAVRNAARRKQRALLKESGPSR
jgi:hypothetical protein